MKQELNPAVVAVVILVVVGIAAFVGFKVLGKTSSGPGQTVADPRYAAYQQKLKTGGGGAPASGGSPTPSGGGDARYQEYQQKMNKQ